MSRQSGQTIPGDRVSNPSPSESRAGTITDPSPYSRWPSTGHRMRNVKLAFRTLFKTPFVTIVAVLSLALGIGANAAIYSLFNQILLRPLPVAQPERLVNLA